ncbi:DUF3221 domain-containing protein [Domibacillus indicus]|uniref:DUF3221 domain-containing protein n=1 Tax=Domibacillus indicus TaxID=1437523 RepID=UPI000617EF5F|nr:DUF3221 domain-containing protein [Domibacillus indicus]
MYKVKNSIAVLLLTAVLSACYNNQADQPSGDDGDSAQQEKPVAEGEGSEKKAVTEFAETTGYIASISPDRIFIVPALEQVNNQELREKEIKGQIFIRTRDMDEREISNLEVGQKVKVSYKGVMYSSPPQAYGHEIEILK